MIISPNNVIEKRFEDLKKEISDILDSEEITFDSLLLKYVPPEILLLHGYLFRYLHKMNPLDNRLTSHDVIEYINSNNDKFSLSLDFSTVMSYGALRYKLMTIAIMKHLENELYNFLKSKRSKSLLENINSKYNKAMIWKIEESEPPIGPIIGG